MVLATREANVTRKLSEEPLFRSAMQFSQVGITRRMQAKGLYMYIHTYLYMGDTGVTIHLAHFREDSSFEASHS